VSQSLDCRYGVWKTPLPWISHLNAEQQLKAEDDNILADIKWARENLGL